MTIFLSSFLLVLLIKQDRRPTKKIVKTLMELFHKIKFSTENAINLDVTFGVILSTVHACMHVCMKIKNSSEMFSLYTIVHNKNRFT